MVALGQYSGLLGDRKEYAYALEIDTINLFCELNDFYLMSVGELLYNQAWDIYESDHIKNKKQYQKNFVRNNSLHTLIKIKIAYTFLKYGKKNI